MKATLKSKTIYIEVPVEEGKVYTTKFQTAEKFKVEKIIRKVINGVDRIIQTEGYYVGMEHIGLCPLPVERLLLEQIEAGAVMICSECGIEHETPNSNSGTGLSMEVMH